MQLPEPCRKGLRVNNMETSYIQLYENNNKFKNKCLRETNPLFEIMNDTQLQGA
jgi:hypothetical protein